MSYIGKTIEPTIKNLYLHKTHTIGIVLSHHTDIHGHSYYKILFGNRIILERIFVLDKHYKIIK